MSPNTISDKTIGRLSLYRRFLSEAAREDRSHIYSHEIARISGVTAAQVRRDLMNIGFTGSPTRGYNVADLVQSISNYLDSPCVQRVALVGVGNLGRALLSYFPSRPQNLRIAATFDSDPAKTGRVVLGCRCHPMDQMESVCHAEGITLAILAVPASEAARVADQMVRAGIRGIMNFANVPLRVPENVYVENIDMTMSLEKVAFFARQRSKERDGKA